jgi:hypothetical protein
LKTSSQSEIGTTMEDKTLMNVMEKKIKLERFVEKKC